MNPAASNSPAPTYEICEICKTPISTGAFCDDCVLEHFGADRHVAEGRNEQHHPLSAAVVPSPGPSPPPGTREGLEPPPIRVLLALHKAGELDPELVELGPLGPNATRPLQAIADDIQLRLGLLLTEGIRQPLMYAVSEAVAAGHTRTVGGASFNLRELCRRGVILNAGSMEPLGKGNGTKLYVPPGWADLIEREPLRGIDGGAA